MTSAEKVCPIVHRRRGGGLEVVAFRHPLAGRQFVKGTIEIGESPIAAALRELHEESGVVAPEGLRCLGQAPIGAPLRIWHFYTIEIDRLPERWDHRTADDGGQVFAFFWHPLTRDLDDDWQPVFHEAFRVIRDRMV